MAMTPSQTVAAQICTAIGIPATGANLATWTPVVDAIRTMVMAATVTVSTTVTGSAATSTGPAVVAGSGTGTGIVT